MASIELVKKYLAHWFQLGKQVRVRRGRTALLPQPVLHGDRYSLEFDACWQQLMAPEAGDCYLEGTTITLTELLTDRWEVIECARCEMPIPQAIAGLPPTTCPCHDLTDWPNNELPPPRSPISTTTYLNQIRQRLLLRPTSER